MQINQEIVQHELCTLVTSLLALPETQSIRIAEVIIGKGECELDEKLQQAVQHSYHDYCSDVDLHIAIDPSAAEPALLSNYAKRVERFGFDPECILGVMLSESNVCRIALKNGIRYDMIFEFLRDQSSGALPTDSIQLQNPPLWSIENINRFWFVQIQALGKLYRSDFLISAHLANCNLNETLVQQMVLRDTEYGTTHHRYGHQEALAYHAHLNKCPIQTGNARFDWIADQIWCAALTYDQLTKELNPDYQPRSADFLEIWKCYEQNRKAASPH